MIYPSINKLMEKVDSRYTLVVATAKRARVLAQGAPKLVKCNSDKSVTVAIHEIADDKVTYRRNKEPLV
ncbi:DNA-directed RNA polymerase subunit omega [Petroclostridium sp. X23]|jgi:DNA-directed RNA polymerase subunit omega|uniref:DNA-directed RNA polymerase subunit omega n=1 Tax=Petroclostridium sp. X23 TaxID=3045146 RepID=UPI0024AC9DFD|nr:DNA-directed RNA polymerase subunit omega [Petroclostridium sp. X23]WHH59903.1 DNA-directed RNA polymerase subunit omega [Petroclostridium sp. X23]